MDLAIAPRRGYPAGDVPRSGRPVLYLVPPLGESDTATSTIWSAERAATVRRDRPGVRLTRRGRIVIGVLLLGVVVAVMALLAPASQAAAPSGPTRTVVVHRGDTLWSIATRALPGVSPDVSVERVRRLNHMGDYTVYVGQQLILPPAR